MPSAPLWFTYTSSTNGSVMLAIGLDIGGANLKAATSDGQAADRPFPLWKTPDRLADELSILLRELPRGDCLAVTMTGELVDGYMSKAEGVRAIVAAAEYAAADRPCWFWQTGGEFVSADEAVELTRLVAAANWHALATFCARLWPSGNALLIDIGSTTTDIIPLIDGRPASTGLTDPERLAAGELLYTGATRTPLCALGPTICWNGETFGLAAEFFATTRDLYLILGQEPEAAEDMNTADGRGATRPHARSRLARMLCADPDEIGDLHELAALLAAKQRAQIREAIQTMIVRSGDCQALLVSGSGGHLARAAIAELPIARGIEIVNLDAMFAKRVSHSACAFAVARLAAERC